MKNDLSDGNFPNVSESRRLPLEAGTAFEDLLQRASFERIPPHQSQSDWKVQTRASLNPTWHLF
jgi:hypothetical protein